MDDDRFQDVYAQNIHDIQFVTNERGRQSLVGTGKKTALAMRGALWYDGYIKTALPLRKSSAAKIAGQEKLRLSERKTARTL